MKLEDASALGPAYGSEDREEEAEIPGPRVSADVEGRGTVSPGSTRVIVGMIMLMMN